MELTGTELPHPGAVELRERCDEHRADRHVDSDAEGVGAADDLEQAPLGEGFDQAPVARQHPGVMDADAGAHQARKRLAEPRREPEPADLGSDLIALLARGDLGVDERLGPLEGRGLREVDDVDRSLGLLQQPLDDVVDRAPLIREVQRHGALDAGDLRHLASRAALEVGHDRGDIAEGRRHEQELHARKKQQRHLPRPAALGVAVVVELVHHDGVDVGIRALPQGDVREDLSGAADDRCVCVDGRVAGDHSHVLGAEDLDQREELLGHERLDRRGVIRTAPASQGRGVGGDRDERLAGAGRGRQHHVRTRDQLDSSLILRRVETDAATLGP